MPTALLFVSAATIILLAVALWGTAVAITKIHRVLAALAALEVARASLQAANERLAKAIADSTTLKV